MAARKPHRLQNQHQYGQMLLPGNIEAKNLDDMSSFKFEGDVLIASYPKTGSTWASDMVWLVVNDGDVTRAKSEQLNDRVPFLETTSYTANGNVTGLETARAMTRPNTFKTHLPPQFFANQLAEKQVKVVVPLRNPKDTLVSLYHFFRSNQELGNFQGTWGEFFEMFAKGPFFYGDIFDWYKSWWAQKDRDNILIVKYEDMKRDLAGELRKISSFLGKGLPDDVIQRIASYGDFDVMKKNNMTNFSGSTMIKQDISPFMRKGQVGDWKNYFTEEQNAFMDRRYAELVRQGLTLDFE